MKFQLFAEKMVNSWETKQGKEIRREPYSAATMAEANAQRRKQNGDQNFAEDFTASGHFR